MRLLTDTPIRRVLFRKELGPELAPKLQLEPLTNHWVCINYNHEAYYRRSYHRA